MASPLRLRKGCFELRFLFHREPGEQPERSLLRCGARLGLIIPKRLAKRATLRNLLKRMAREAFRQAGSALPAADVVLKLVSAPQPVVVSKADLACRRSWRRNIDELLAGLVR
jgi:ribonuclease P protein component